MTVFADLMATSQTPAPARALRVLATVQWAAIGVLIAASFTLEALGHSGASWAVDGVALALYLAARLAWSRLQSPTDRTPPPPDGPGRTHP